jgi:hypothetical protein
MAAPRRACTKSSFRSATAGGEPGIPEIGFGVHGFRVAAPGSAPGMTGTCWVLARAIATSLFVLALTAPANAQSSGNFSTLTASGTATLNGDVVMCSGHPWIDVRCPSMAGGAVGDGSHDDTAAIRATFAAAAANGWPVHLPAGTYKVTGLLTIDYAGTASTGFRLISEGAVIDGRTIPSGPVLQVMCSGGSIPSPASCFYFREQGTLSLWGNSGGQNLASLTAAATAGDTVLAVSTAAPFFAGETVLVALSGGGTFASPIASVGGSSITLQNALPSGAANNAAVSITSYPFVFGTNNFADAHNSAKIDHLLVNNASTAAGAGGCQFNYVLDSDIFAVCVSAGGAAGLALEQVQFSRLAGAGTAEGTGGAGLVLENGYNISNLFSAFDLEVSPTCLAITDRHDGMNSWVSPYFNCNTAVSATGSTHNVLINPTYGGNVVNRGPQSQGVQIIGTGNRVPWQYPASATYVASGIDSGTTLSSAEAAGASLAVTLPNPDSIDDGWWMGFASDNNKGLSLTAPSGTSILAGGHGAPSLTLGPGNYEYVKLQSDGQNFRVVGASRNTRLYGGVEAAAFPGNAWLFPSTTGYAATLGDNGNVLSSFNATGGLTVTLPSTTGLSAGWAIGLAADNGNGLSVNVNGTAGGNIVYPRTLAAPQTSLTLAGHNYEFVALQYDGNGSFRVVNATPATAQQIGMAGPGGIANWLFPATAAYTATKADNGNAISAFNSPQSYFALTLPATSTIAAGWTIAVASDNGKATSVQVNGGAGEKILVPGTLGAQTALTLASNTSGYELVVLQFDGSNFRMVSATPLTANASGMATLIGTPASLTAPCQTGAFETDGVYLYLCTAPSTWKEVPVGTFAIDTWSFPAVTSYAATASDGGKAISSFNAPGVGMGITLPPTDTIAAGWTIGVATDAGKTMTVAVQGGHGEKILVPGTAGALTSLPLPTNTAGYELVVLQFDGANFRVLSATPLTANASGMATLIGTPADTGACNTGAIETDGAYLYVCAAPNTWKRAALSSY